MFCMLSTIFEHCFDFRLILVGRNALQGTSIGSTLHFAAVCAPYAGRKSEEIFVLQYFVRF